jgi:hypothetical protein
MHIQQVENAIFNLASCKTTHPEGSIKSLDNISEKLTQAVYDTYSTNCQFRHKYYSEENYAQR